MGNPPRAKNPNMIGVVWENPQKPLKTPKNGPKTASEPKNGPKTAPEPKNRVFRPRRVLEAFDSASRAGSWGGTPKFFIILKKLKNWFYKKNKKINNFKPT